MEVRAVPSLVHELDFEDVQTCRLAERTSPVEITSRARASDSAAQRQAGSGLSRSAHPTKPLNPRCPFEQTDVNTQA